jgi:hypothetical protein
MQPLDRKLPQQRISVNSENAGRSAEIPLNSADDREHVLALEVLAGVL